MNTITATPVRFLDRTTPPHILTLILLSGLSALSMNIFLPSLPAMAQWFDADYATMQLSVSIYLAFSAVLQVIIGPLSDRYGRRQAILWSIGVFMAATLGTLLAPDATSFLVFRTLQAAAATSMALSRAVVRDMVDETHAASMIGYITLGMTIVPMLGPILGGVLDEWYGWQASFAMLLVMGAVVWLLTWADLGETATTRPTSFMAQVRDFPELLRSPRFWGYVATSTFSSGVFFAYLGGAAFVGTTVYGLTSSTLGMYFALTAIGYGAGNYLSGRYSTAIGVNRMALWGNVSMLVGLLGQCLSIGFGWTSPLGFFGFFMFVGLGNGMTLPNSMAGMLSVRPHLAGTASGLGGAMMIGGGALLSALAGLLLVPGAGAWPLVAIMLGSATLAMTSILFVIWRAKTKA